MPLKKKSLVDDVKISSESSTGSEYKPQYTTPEERMSRDKALRLGGMTHDAAQIFVVLYQINPDKSDQDLSKRAVDITIQLRDLLNERLPD